MKLKLLTDAKTTIVFPKETNKIFYPIEIINTFLFFKFKTVAYPTEKSYSSKLGDWFVKYVDENGKEYDINDCKQFTEFTILNQRY